MLKPGTPVDLPQQQETAAPVAPATEPQNQTPGLNAVTAAVVLLTIAALYFGRDIFLPFALAVLLSFMLAPPVAWLRRLHLPRVTAVLIVVTSAFALICGLSVLVASQAVNIAENLPTYQQTMQQKIRSIRAAAPGGGAIDRTTEVIQALGEELSKDSTPEPSSKPSKARAKEPIPVRVEPQEKNPLDTVREMVAPMLGPIGTAGLVIIFIFFVLLEPSDLRDRFIRLAGSDLHRTTEALSEAARRVSRYLLMQLIINASYGVPIGIGLYLIGVPGAFLWALLATLLRFIPYLGPVIAALFPITLAFAVDPGWDMLLWTVALVATMELISNNIIEPWLYGASTGLSPVAVILAAIFWTLLWGPIGLILATPLTVCLVVMGRYVPQLAFLDVLLGSDPVLLPEQRLYQRFLAGNIEEAIEIAEAQVAEESLLSFYDQVGLPALRLAEDDGERGVSLRDRTQLADGVRAVVRDLREQLEKEEPEQDASQPASWFDTPVLCIAGRGELDTAAVAMLAHGLESSGVGVRCAPPSAVTLEAIGELDLSNTEVVCLSYLIGKPHAYARFVCRRLKRRMPHLKILLCAWNLSPENGTPEQLRENAGADAVAASLSDAVRIVAEMVTQKAPAMVPPPLPTEEKARLDALQRSGALDARKGAHLDRIARKVADAFDTPIGLVSLIDESCQLWKGAVGLPPELDKTRQGTRDTSICGHVVAANAPLVVEDTARDPRFADNAFLREQNIRFYAGVPLRAASGHVIGSLCVIDRKPRTLSPREVKLLQVVADELMAELEAKADAAAAPAGDGSTAEPQLPPGQISAAGA